MTKRERDPSDDMSLCHNRGGCINEKQGELTKDNYHKSRLRGRVQLYYSVCKQCRNRSYKIAENSPYNSRPQGKLWDMTKASWAQQWLCRRWV